MTTKAKTTKNKAKTKSKKAVPAKRQPTYYDCGYPGAYSGRYSQTDKTVTNTTVQTRHILDALPGMIEASEHRGQRELVKSEVLPTRGLYQAPAKSDGEFSALPGCLGGKRLVEIFGIKIVGPVEGDDLFTHVELPAGWTKKSTDHYMYSDLVDERGRKRATIMYKAAFYDRDASVSFVRRYEATFAPPGDDWSAPEKRYHAVVKDGGKEIWRSEETFCEEASAKNDWKSGLDMAQRRACGWLKANKPDWESFTAYWDEE